MKGILKAITIIAIVAIVIVAGLFVLDIVTSTEVRETLQKVLLVLSIIALGGGSISILIKKEIIK